MSKKHSMDTKSVIDPSRIFYWAYGSNLCIRQMKNRCPRAIMYGPMKVRDCALIFRGVADVTMREGVDTMGGLWQITTACERSLDAYEGVAQKKYLKRYFQIKIKGKAYTCLFYQMRAKEGILPPTTSYLGTILQGYKDFGLSPDGLDAALQESWEAKEISDELADWREQRGYPQLARTLEDAAYRHAPTNFREERHG